MNRLRALAPVLPTAFLGLIAVPVAHAISIDSATFYEEAFCLGQPIAYGTDDLLPESVSLDFSAGNQQCVVAVLTSPTGPQLDVQANAVNQTMAHGKATITYYLQIDPVVAGAPEGPVRVVTTVIGSASALASDGGAGNVVADALFDIWIPDPLGSAASGGFRKFSGAACDDGDSSNGAGCSGNSQTNVEVNEVFDLYLPVGQMLQVRKHGEAAAGLGTGTGDSQAVADPLFQIAPEFSDYYTIVYSPNLAVVPVPAAAWLLVSALAGLAGLRRRAQRAG